MRRSCGAYDELQAWCVASVREPEHDHRVIAKWARTVGDDLAGKSAHLPQGAGFMYVSAFANRPGSIVL